MGFNDNDQDDVTQGQEFVFYAVGPTFGIQEKFSGYDSMEDAQEGIERLRRQGFTEFTLPHAVPLSDDD